MRPLNMEANAWEIRDQGLAALKLFDASSARRARRYIDSGIDGRAAAGLRLTLPAPGQAVAGFGFFQRRPKIRLR